MNLVSTIMDASRAPAPLEKKLRRTVRLGLETLDDEQLRTLASQLIRLRPLGPFPGWRFGIFAESEEPEIIVRSLIWRELHKRKNSIPIVSPWHHGSQVHFYLGNDMSFPTYLGGCIEPNEFAFLDGLLKPGMTFVDVGANDGFFSVFAATKVGGSGRVVSFEPSSREFARLRANIELNVFSHVTCVNAALAEETGTAVLKIAEYEHEGQNTLGDFMWDVKACDQETVPLVRLDDEMARLGIDRLDVMKIDVEGAELKVLRGGLETLRKFRPTLLMECAERALGFQGGTVAEIQQLFADNGYRILGFDAETGRCEVPGLLSDNIAAVPVEREI